MKTMNATATISEALNGLDALKARVSAQTGPSPAKPFGRRGPGFIFSRGTILQNVAYTD